MLLRESMGVSADSTQKAFPSENVEKFMKRRLQEIPVDIMEFHSRHNTNHIIVAVDPAGGGSSQFAIASLLQLPSGTVVVSRPVSKCFPWPHLTEKQRHENKALWILAAVLVEAGLDEGEDPLRHVASVAFVPCSQMLLHPLLGSQSTQKHCPLAGYTVSSVGVHVDDGAYLHCCVLARIRITVHSRDQILNAPQVCMYLWHIVISLVPVVECGAHEHLSQGRLPLQNPMGVGHGYAGRFGQFIGSLSARQLLRFFLRHMSPRCSSSLARRSGATTTRWFPLGAATLSRRLLLA